MSRWARIALLFFAAILPAVAAAQDRGQREVLAEKIIHASASRAEQADVELELMDASSRALFKQLRSDSAWGPDYPGWQRHFPGFLAAFGALNARDSDANEQKLKAALVERMTESELAQIAAAQDSPTAADFRSLMKEVGLDFGSAIRIFNIVSMPALYSRAEKDAVRAKMMALKAREEELKAMKPRIDAALAVYHTPAFGKYQQLMAGMIRQFVSQLQENPAARKEMQEFLTAWRARVEQN